MSLTALVAPPRYLLGQALHAEWTKFRTVAGPAWLLAGVVTVTAAVGAAAASVAQCQSATCGIDPAAVSFTGIYPSQAIAAVAGVLAISNDYSTGMIKLSLTATPRRLTWFFAKATVLTAAVLAVAGAALAGRLILPGHGFTPAHGYETLTSATDVRAAAGAVLYLTLIALLSIGLAAAVRDSATAIGLANPTPSPPLRRHFPAGSGSAPSGAATTARYSSSSGPGRSASQASGPSGGPAYGSGAKPASSASVGTSYPPAASIAAISASRSASALASTCAVAESTRASSLSLSPAPAAQARRGPSSLRTMGAGT